jgi:hypothetical protein
MVNGCFVVIESGTTIRLTGWHGSRILLPEASTRKRSGRTAKRHQNAGLGSGTSRNLLPEKCSPLSEAKRSSLGSHGMFRRADICPRPIRIAIGAENDTSMTPRFFQTRCFEIGFLICVKFKLVVKFLSLKRGFGPNSGLARTSRCRVRLVITEQRRRLHNEYQSKQVAWCGCMRGCLDCCKCTSIGTTTNADKQGTGGNIVDLGCHIRELADVAIVVEFSRFYVRQQRPSIPVKAL